MNWSVYMILAQDDSLYTGISTDVTRRMQEHQAGKRGAKYFHGRAPVALVYVEAGHTRSSASKREAEIKSLKKTEKHALISRHAYLAQPLTPSIKDRNDKAAASL